MPRALTPEQIERATEIWESGVSRAEFAAQMDMPIWFLDEHKRIGDLQHLTRRQGQGGGSYDRSVDIDAEPSPDEIVVFDSRRLEVQRSWSPVERENRRGAGRLPDSYRPPRFGFAVEPARGMVRTGDLDIGGCRHG